MSCNLTAEKLVAIPLLMDVLSYIMLTIINKQRSVAIPLLMDVLSYRQSDDGRSRVFVAIPLLMDVLSYSVFNCFFLMGLGRNPTSDGCALLSRCHVT